MAFTYDNRCAHDFDKSAISFKVRDGDAVETWRVSEMALQDVFGSREIGPALIPVFESNAYTIVEVGNELRPLRGGPLFLQSSDFGGQR